MRARVGLSEDERAMMAGAQGPGAAMALRIVVEAARLLGAERLVPVTSAHIDGCLYHGDSGVFFAERLLELGARVAVPATLNVGSLDLLHPEVVQGDERHRAMSRRLMDAHLALGCTPSWTCAPYQAGHRPAPGEQVAWGESNAVAFVNSVLGARSNRYGDFLDLCCAIAGRAPYCGLHMTENRRATLVLDLSGLSPELRAAAAFYPVLGALLGRLAGGKVAAILGVPPEIGEDALKALGAGAASKGAVGLFHVVGLTPEAPTLEAALQGRPPERVIEVTAAELRAARDNLSSATDDSLGCIALGSPHFSYEECRELARLSAGCHFSVPVYVCTGRHVSERLAAEGLEAELESRGVTFVVDTCVVVTPIIKRVSGALMTNSAKFAHYGRPNTGLETVYGSLADCVASAEAGRVRRDESLWQ